MTFFLREYAWLPLALSGAAKPRLLVQDPDTIIDIVRAWTAQIGATGE